MGDNNESPPSPPDSDVLASVAQGDRTALGVLYDRFSRPLFATALRILSDAKEAEDVVHDVFVTIWEKAPEFESSKGSPFGWAVALTRNRSIDRFRQRRRRQEILAATIPDDLGYAEDAPAADSSAALSFKEKAVAIRHAVAALPTDQQHAVELAFFSGLTQQEIAERLQQPLGTIKARIRRGLLKLRDVLSPQL
ncbi:MAG TPA: sigma-70 family RNA polymerase sigma factor [Opitutaceae bacterium]|jgi:RNA polymerase sigma-70 factor (ECF subfamily)|nr:sigma-70 family RNA polymerase sigma factor [Opitutaceae bacterium]